MKHTRRLWASIIFVMILTSASIAGLVSGALTPVLGLDLQGGVAVILSAPDGTPADVMETALENIRRRVDAFGVGEPDIFLSGNTIEIQIPGASDSTVEQRTVDLTCLGDDETTYGCGTEEEVDAALAGLEVTSQPSQVCSIRIFITAPSRPRWRSTPSVSASHTRSVTSSIAPSRLDSSSSGLTTRKLRVAALSRATSRR